MVVRTVSRQKRKDVRKRTTKMILFWDQLVVVIVIAIFFVRDIPHVANLKECLRWKRLTPIGSVVLFPSGVVCRNLSGLAYSLDNFSHESPLPSSSLLLEKNDIPHEKDRHY